MENNFTKNNSTKNNSTKNDCFLTDEKKIIKKEYKEPKLIKYDKKIWDKIFGFNKFNEKLIMTDIGIYSIAKPYLIEKMDNILSGYLRNYTLKNLTVTEYGSVGGFTKILCKKFKHVNIIEKQTLHKQVIENNMKIMGNDNFKVYCEDLLDIYMEVNQDIIIADPPWGGTEYDDEKYLKLGYDNLNIACLINRLIDNRKFKFFVLYVPKNFDFVNFLKIVKIKKFHLEKIGLHYVLIFENL